MSNGYILSKGAVETFLKEVRQILEYKNSELIIIERNDKPKGYNTSDCRTILGINNEDIKKYIQNLTVKDYVESCDNERNLKSYYVFCIDIQQKQIYIKIRIQSYEKKIILCMSFHFAEYKITKFPYK